VINPNLPLAAKNRIPKVQPQIQAQIIPWGWSPTATGLGGPPSKATEDSLKDISKAAHVPHILEARRTSASTHPCFPKAIVAGS